MTQQVYADQAAKQRAYRARQKTIAAARVSAGFAPTPPPALTPPLQYRQWRTAIAEATALLERTAEDVEAWMADRSERWQESERGVELTADHEKLQEILEALSGLEALSA